MPGKSFKLGRDSIYRGPTVKENIGCVNRHRIFENYKWWVLYFVLQIETLPSNFNKSPKKGGSSNSIKCKYKHNKISKTNIGRLYPNIHVFILIYLSLFPTYMHNAIYNTNSSVFFFYHRLIAIRNWPLDVIIGRNSCFIKCLLKVFDVRVKQRSMKTKDFYSWNFSRLNMEWK